MMDVPDDRRWCFMRRTYSLRLLLIVMTAACVVFALISAFPRTAAISAMTFSYFVPGIVVGGLLSLLTSQPARARAIALLGSLGGFLCAPRNLDIWGDFNLIYWEIYRRDFYVIAAYATFGAFLGSLIALALFPFWRKSSARDDADSQHK
jgi:hypothetical protein